MMQEEPSAADELLGRTGSAPLPTGASSNANMSKAYHSPMAIELITGDCRDVMWQHGPFDMILADSPYGDTSLDWDKHVRGWEVTARELMKPTGSM